MENQFVPLKNWMHVILNAIKKDIKQDHLGSDPEFYRTHFGSRPQNRLTAEEIFNAYEKELIQGNQELAEWVVNRWVFKNGDLYQIFADRLAKINPEFDKIQTLTEEESEKVLAGTVEKFGAVSTFLFVVLNGVVFPESVRSKLQRQAEVEKVELEKKTEAEEGRESLEKLLAAKEREIARLNDKILGVQKKYDRDTEALKKQIKALQKR
ncbi:MAG: hypothetical protein K1X28_02700 [Parachlamydiales bacterium]|nr:hypothetical protein [Parachlamydiales bacterium]